MGLRQDQPLIDHSNNFSATLSPTHPTDRLYVHSYPNPTTGSFACSQEMSSSAYKSPVDRSLGCSHACRFLELTLYQHLFFVKRFFSSKIKGYFLRKSWCSELWWVFLLCSQTMLLWLSDLPEKFYVGLYHLWTPSQVLAHLQLSSFLMKIIFSTTLLFHPWVHLTPLPVSI